MALLLTVNGEDRTSGHGAMTPLVDVLRDEFHLKGAKPVCREGFCGACTVLLDDHPVMACLLPAGLAVGARIRTVESLAPDGALSPLQQVMEEHDVVQCGMCFPGMLMSLSGFLAVTPRPTRDEVKAALSGNVCRCTGYERIIDAVLSL
ncbi:(2Fe-2S)-binding protein [Chelatococcus reniformis]|uniref:(2Fe-2S)-binding protein n=1 Tax=Chelatococcus reniformis TaxID=1494448 RepID=A0A916X9M9_9HYPH|nr:(2Fe-2S)-binding protein [Chelatococcus reniformis]GGC57646.1 (2Fe-2S)-binding protein [Chelatococcus reniformis]